jgi:hypothetical protein
VKVVPLHRVIGQLQSWVISEALGEVDPSVLRSTSLVAAVALVFVVLKRQGSYAYRRYRGVVAILLLFVVLFIGPRVWFSLFR